MTHKVAQEAQEADTNIFLIIERNLKMYHGKMLDTEVTEKILKNITAAVCFVSEEEKNGQ